MRGRKVSSVDETNVLSEAQKAAEVMLNRTRRHALIDNPEGFFGATRYLKKTVGWISDKEEMLRQCV